MRSGADRRPGAIPDDEVDGGGVVRAVAGGADVRGGADTDGDGRADTLVTADGGDLLVLADLDADGLADRVLQIGPDGSVHASVAPGDGHPAAPVLDGPVAGSAPATPGPWSVLLGRLFGFDP